MNKNSDNGLEAMKETARAPITNLSQDDVRGGPDRPVPGGQGLGVEQAGGNGHHKNDAEMAPTSQPDPGLPRKEIDFTSLEDGTLVELIEDPQDPEHTLLAVWKHNQIQYLRKLETERGRLVPLPRQDSLLRHLRLPRGTKAYGSSEDLLLAVKDFITRCVELPPSYAPVLASFVLSTWLVDRLPLAPYLSVSGMPQSGKTTLLKVLSLVCRRALLTADVSTAAVYGACNRFTPTLLIDEAGTHGSNGSLRHLLRSGTTRDVVAMRRGHSYHAYGAKILSFIEPPDDLALNSRCIQISLTEASRRDLLRPTDPVIEAQAAELQKALLQFRFEHYRSIRPAVVPGAEGLRPRARDLLSCLAAPFADIPEISDWFLKFFEQKQRTESEPLPLAENVVLSYLYYVAHSHRGVPGDMVIGISGLACNLNTVLKLSGERIQLSPRKVGAVLTSLQLTQRQRTKKGWQVWLTRADRERIHQLADLYGLDYLPPWEMKEPPEKCALCQARARAREIKEAGARGERGEHLRRKARKKRKGGKP